MSSTTIPLVQTQDRLLNQVQQNFRQALSPVLSNVLVSGYIISNVVLASGSNTVQHVLGRPVTGWLLVRVRGNTAVYDTQDANTTPSATLLLTSVPVTPGAAVTVDLYVF